MVSRERGKKKKLLLIIGLMILLIIAMCIWLAYRAAAMNQMRTQSVLGTLEESDRTVADSLSAADEIALSLQAAMHVYSHRGKEGPQEHSFKAYDEAIDAGSVNIEQDLVLSRDGVLFVSHDLSASSMTGTARAYVSMDADDIDQLRTRAGNKILRLSEVFDRYGSKIRYVIELKAYDDSRMVDAFSTLVDEYGYQGIIIVQCKDLGTLRSLEEIYPDMPKLYVCRTQGGFEASLDEDCVDIISVNAGLMSAERCKEAHGKGKLFSAWTLNSERQIRNAIDIGADTYFTNDTPMAISIEKEYGLKKRLDNKR